MKYEQNMTGWNLAMRDIGLTAETMADDSRLKSILRLINSGLETYEYHILSIDDFFRDEEKVKGIFKKYSGMVVARAVSEDAESQRYTFINKGFEEIKDDLKRKLSVTQSGEYKIILNEYDPARYCGVIISKKERLIIEMAEEPNLEKLCHGEIIPYSAEFSELVPYSYRKMTFWKNYDENIKKTMWSVVKSISSQNFESELIPIFEPRLGYFEFAISERTGLLKFIDYKL